MASLGKAKKLISWCLYVDPDNLQRLPEYLMGLKCNQRAARMHFPDWKLRLYVDKTLDQCPEMADYVRDLAHYGTPEIDLVQCREDSNPMVERFRALLDDTVDVVLVRDVDSILSRTDADLVNAWLEDDDDDIDVFRYREYQMNCRWSMGGGMGGRTRAFASHLDHLDVVKKRGRNQDEGVLAQMLSHIPLERQREVITRMTCEGTYMMMDSMHKQPKDCTVLWAVPFFDGERGWGYECHPELRGATVPQVVEWCKGASIRREHTGAHYEHHRDTIVKKTEGWVR